MKKIIIFTLVLFLGSIGVQAQISTDLLHNRLNFLDPDTASAFLYYDGSDLKLSMLKNNSDLILTGRGGMDLRVNGQSRLYINSLGFLGIMTSTPTARLDVNGDIALSNADGTLKFSDGNDLQATISFNSANQNFLLNNGTAGGDLLLATVEDISFLTNTVDTRMVIRQSGNVGIGVSNPDELLEVNGSMSLTDGGGQLNFDDGPSNNAYLQLSGIDFNIRTLQTGGDINVDAFSNMYFSNNNVERMRIMLDGVGINLSGVPQDQLDVNGDITLSDGTGGINFREGSTVKAGLQYNGQNFILSNGEAGGDLLLSTTDRLTLSTAGSARMTVLSNGRVGIGTIGPSAALDVNGDIDLSDGTGKIRFRESALEKARIEYNGLDLFVENAETGGWLYLNGDNRVYFRTNGMNRMLINSAGTVVMNQDLSVANDAVISNNLTVQNDLTVEEELIIGTVGVNQVGTFVLHVDASLRPAFDNFDALGSGINRWTEVWAVDGTINTSDADDKENIRELEYGLEEIMKLKPVKFEWKENKRPKDKIGLLAEEVAEVIDEVVVDYEGVRDEESGELSYVKTEKLGMFYSDLIPVLIKAIQEQQSEIATLRAEAAKVRDLESRLRQLELLVNNR